MNYLARLRERVFSTKHGEVQPTEPTKAPFDGFVGNTPALVSQKNAVNDAASDALPDPGAEARQQRVLAMLRDNPGGRYALLTDLESDPEAAILVLAIRGRATCELRIPREKYDPFLLLDLIERHGGTVH